MAKIGVSISIDVTKIDRDRLFKGKKGQYLDLTTFIDLDQEDQYGKNGFISQSLSKEEREMKSQTPILGNVKVFYKEGSSPSNSAPQLPADDFDDDLPF